MANRLFQGVVHQMRDIIDRNFGVLDENSVVIACNELAKIGQSHDFSFDDIDTTEDVTVRGEYIYKTFGTIQEREYTVFVEGTDEQSKRYAGILAITLTNIKQYNDEKSDRGNFIKNVILDNILPGDIHIKAREHKFNANVERVAILTRLTSKNDVSVFNVIQNLFPDKSKDFVINLSETDIVIVKELMPGVEPQTLENLALSIVDTLSGEFYTHARIGIGTPVGNIKDLAKSFKEAQVALEVGKVFGTEKIVISYNSLGIARLIYQLPTTLCESFLREVFKKNSIESLDRETLFTIQRFFENNLNVSETSRKLFVHRNTLVYRLEKIKKLTGLDLREFDNAIVFKIALMVQKYLDTNPTKF